MDPGFRRGDTGEDRDSGGCLRTDLCFKVDTLVAFCSSRTFGSLPAGENFGIQIRPMANTFDTYLLKLRQTPLSDHTEHTGRSALEGLLNEFAAAASGRVAVQHEPKRAAGK